MPQPKDEFVQIRFAHRDRERVREVAAANHLDMSSWARRAILMAVEDWEREQLAKHNQLTDKKDSR